jgi:hypothetical protein
LMATFAPAAIGTGFLPIRLMMLSFLAYRAE